MYHEDDIFQSNRGMRTILTTLTRKILLSSTACPRPATLSPVRPGHRLSALPFPALGVESSGFARRWRDRVRSRDEPAQQDCRPPPRQTPVARQSAPGPARDQESPMVSLSSQSSHLLPRLPAWQQSRYQHHLPLPLPP